jgi:hypothetical protein
MPEDLAKPFAPILSHRLIIVIWKSLSDLSFPCSVFLCFLFFLGLSVFTCPLLTKIHYFSNVRFQFLQFPPPHYFYYIVKIYFDYVSYPLFSFFFPPILYTKNTLFFISLFVVLLCIFFISNPSFSLLHSKL